MQCVICKMGETAEGLANVTLHRDESTIVIKGVPAQICENCGEYYLSNDITEKVMDLAETAVKNNVEVEVLRFAA